ncbi:MAG: Unknown protein [uncultured Sulfurovum sp.]|uniref:Paraquat-inducible protein A n=1 Tax=uncultured Sulfurovum sp. TaxID=269237 RepID=A0A6S6SD66_9BACT|nr:MAG: Unknown protein [uncultured Sulfurovum sp.]
MKIIKLISSLVAVLLLCIVVYFSVELIKSGEDAKSYKRDYAELHSVKYGMFNSDAWTMKITKVVERKIDNFNLNVNNRDQIEGYVSTIIDTLIIETERIVKERNKNQSGFFSSFMGSTKQMLTDSIVDFKDLRNRVPEFTSAVMIEIEKPENQERVKKVLREKLKEFMNNKFKASTDMTTYNKLVEKYDSPEVLDKKIEENSEYMHSIMLKIVSLSGIILLMVVFQGRLNSLSLLTLSGTTLSLLVTGIMLPMLDIEAKISKLNFVVLDQAIIFENQILFFQSKSITDLLVLLLESGEGKMIFVGILLVMFSIIFPLLKLIATTIYYYSAGAMANNGATRFFALYSTKWSMADVMVVSMFMAYLGLDGVVDNELKKLGTQDDPVNIITFNGTHLEVGFFLFLSFVLISFVLSILVEKSRKSKDEESVTEKEIV